MLDSLRSFGELTLKGLISVNAPTIFQGMLNTWFTRYKITPEVVIPVVVEDKSLWSLLPPEHHNQAHRAVTNIGNADWLTVDWVIEAIKKEHPAMASLFLSWRKGRNWLARQIKEIKTELDLGGLNE